MHRIMTNLIMVDDSTESRGAPVRVAEKQVSLLVHRRKTSPSERSIDGNRIFIF